MHEGRKDIESVDICKGIEEGISVYITIFVGFQQWNRVNFQTINSDIFYRQPNSNAQRVIVRAEKSIAADTNKLYPDDDSAQSYGQIERRIQCLTKDGNLEP